MADENRKMTYIFLNKKDIEETYQTISDEELETMSKEVVGAINELNVKFQEIRDKIEMDDTARSIVNEALVNITLLAAAIDESEGNNNEVFTEEGLYNPTTWVGGDLITDVLLNKNEQAIYGLSQRAKSTDATIYEINKSLNTNISNVTKLSKTVEELTEQVDGNTENVTIINNNITEITNNMTEMNKNINIKISEVAQQIQPSVRVVKTYNDIQYITGAQEGLVYVKSDEERKNGDPNIYVIISVKVTEDGETVPDEYVPLNEFTKSDVPTLSYDDALPADSKIYLSTDNDLIITFKFDSDTYGDGKYKVYRDGMLMKSFSGDKGTVMANLGPIKTEGTYEITVTATDFLGIPAPQTLKYKVVIGGLKFSSSFDNTLKGVIFEVNDSLSFPYIVSVSDSESKIKIDIKLSNGVDTFEETINVVGSATSGIWTVDNIPSRGLYTLEAQAYTGESPDDTTEGTFVSDKLSYSFNVLSEGEIAIISNLPTNEYDNNTYISIPFIVTSKVAKYFVVRGKLYKKNASGGWDLYTSTSDLGIECTVSVTSYWSVRKLEIGEYKYELKAYTVDGGIQSLESAVNEIFVVESAYKRVQPVMTNLVAWFDANEKRNTDENKDIWQNNALLSSKYSIKLHDLNYSSNGWKHVDSTLSDSDDGEFMLKFTGDSYGEMLVENNDGTVTNYNPFALFKNTGLPGFAFETAIRTRSIGNATAKVLTCMEYETSDTPGVAIGVDTLYLGSNSRTTKLNLNEDEWTHVTFVVDRNIRDIDDVGQDGIENLNPVNTMRIYINGVLCACNSFKDDIFLDASGNAFPLFLNGCKNNKGEMTNFGECEIKFIRIYESYLTSADVLNNYIAHIYDSTEQQEMKDRNDVTKSSLPTIVFKRKITSSNQSTFSLLNSITDKKQSKKTCVDCTMEFDDGQGNITVIDNVDVYLQGTSSLQYPVKNYKIKVYQDDEHKLKAGYVPPGKEEEWVPDYTYTLKCDYMEQSHMNNTPTARFYDQVVDHLGSQSPARKQNYRDSIDGFPCILYYNDHPDSQTNTLIGSFMFNIDKAGAELGFECDIVDDEGNIIGSGAQSCISYEGTANASDTAGCFYKFEESINNIYETYMKESHKAYLVENGITEFELSLPQFKEKVNKGELNYSTFEEFLDEYDEIDYVMSDFEARYSYCEDDDDATYRPMLNLINWIGDAIDNGTFKDEFEDHFDLNYMLAYYLQMQVFTQVDNCGKNCMWDTWDGVKFYPRPYDMDKKMCCVSI